MNTHGVSFDNQCHLFEHFVIDLSTLLSLMLKGVVFVDFVDLVCQFVSTVLYSRYSTVSTDILLCGAKKQFATPTLLLSQ